MMSSTTILHEDDHLLAVAKPAGIATANVPAGEESLFSRMKRRPTRSPDGPFLGVVSRLDRPVSGVVVFAKTRAAAASLAEQFRGRAVGKTYFAVVEGRFPAPLGRWADWSDRIDATGKERGRMPSRVAKGETAAEGEGHFGQEASLRARVVRRAGEISLVELRPATGRRHQLRAQLAARGCPIVGDRMYGSRLPFEEGIALHAREIVFSHPHTGEACRVVADFPASWRRRFSGVLAAIPPSRG